ncbi:Hypothetical protein PHPALM_15233 [Phytophthora palmivora]|uniref:Uncharacterized protein n=1 Tax=Phytophthora palmivora TaxID=4796 RepID=A0A2P4XSR4_9STRA|nr:Hypothetical protein PHPALM_15233 [Phytophthora palmivora]
MPESICRKRWVGIMLPRSFPGGRHPSPYQETPPTISLKLTRGICIARLTVNISDEDLDYVAMADSSNIEYVKKGNHLRIIQSSNKNEQLPRHATKELSEKKMKSLAAK